MEKTKKILNISIAVSIVLCSLSIFVYSCQSNPTNVANAQTTITDNDYKIVGVFTTASSNGYYVSVIGYNASTKDIKVLAKKDNVNY